MKRIILACLSLSIVSLTINAQAVPAKSTGQMNSPNSMKGAYLMTMQKFTQNNKDTMLDAKQLKIYTDGYFMYAHTVGADTVGSYGVGTYKMQGGNVVEHVFYTSDNGAQEADFTVKIAKSPDGYSQVIHYPADASGPEAILTESYKTVSKKLASSLDGAWKMTKVTFIATDGTPTVDNNPVQYKFYQSGHFMFGSTQTDPATKKTSSNIGYGSFAVNGPDEITETPMNSSYRTMINTPVKLKLELKGKDHYQQTIKWDDGSKLIEEYERMK
jgi:hypothetical protein